MIPVKDGHIEVYRDNQKTTITLITCKKKYKRYSNGLYWLFNK